MSSLTENVIEFKAAPRRSKARFLRVSTSTNQTDFEKIYKTFIKNWDIYKPRFLMSITGGKKNFYLPKKVAKNIDKGLCKLVDTPGIWFITGGTNAGVSKYVAKILRGTGKVCIGITGWSSLNDREDLLGLSSPQKKNYNKERVFDYDTSQCLTERGAFLDNNHTHFLIIGNENIGQIQYGTELEFRSKFESFVTERENINSIVMLLEGGLTSLQCVLNALRQDHPSTVVIVNGSGRASDCLAYALKNKEEILQWDHNDVAIQENKFYEFVKDKMERNNEQDIIFAYRQIIECLRFSYLIHIYELNSCVGLDEVVFNALLATKIEGQGERYIEETQWFSLLKNAILWKRIDLGAEILLKSRKVLKEEHYQHAMIMSLALNRVDFVSLLMEYDINMNKTLSPDIFSELYGFALQRYKSSTKRLQHLLTEAVHCRKRRSLFANLDLYTLYNFQCKLVDRLSVVKTVNELCSDLTVGREELLQMFTQEEEDSNMTKHPFKELFYWAVLNNMMDMAFFLWQFDKEGMIKALIAAYILKTLSAEAKKTGLNKEVISIYRDNSDLFKKHAVLLLNECSEKDVLKTKHLITSPTKHIISVEGLAKENNQTCLKLAVSSAHSKFVSHATVQCLLDDLWIGGLQEINFWNALIGYFVPFWVLYFPEFKTLQEIRDMVRQENIEDNLSETCSCKNNNGDKNKAKKHWSFYFRNDVNDEESQDITFVPKATSLYGSFDVQDFPLSSEDILSTCDEPKTLTAYEKFKQFHKAPVVTFYKNTVWFVLFLIMLSYTAIRDKHNDKPHVIEYILLTIVTSKLAEEIRQCISGDANGIYLKARLYFRSNWNLLDLAAILLFFVAFGMHSEHPKNPISHLFYALDAGLWIIRLMNMFYVHPILGPYTIMIYRMFIDMAYFLVILLMFFLAYAVATTALLTPTDNISMMILNIIFQPYYNIYGELFIKGSSSSPNLTRFDTPVLNSYAEPASLVLLGIYLLMANVLLLNVLIAIFNNTFTEIQENAEEIWKFQRYSLVIEYQNYSYFLPPFNILSHVYVLTKWIFQKYKEYRDGRKKNVVRKKVFCSSSGKCGCHSHSKDTKTNLRKFSKSELTLFEVECMATLMRKQEAEKEKEKKRHFSLNQTKKLTSALQEIQNDILVMKNVINDTKND